MSETQKRLAEIEARLKAATPGPWTVAPADIAWLLELAKVPDPGMALVECCIAWRDWASHQEWCRTCAEDSVGSCLDGVALKEAAEAADKRCAELGIDALNADKSTPPSERPNSVTNGEANG